MVAPVISGKESNSLRIADDGSIYMTIDGQLYYADAVTGSAKKIEHNKDIVHKNAYLSIPIDETGAIPKDIAGKEGKYYSQAHSERNEPTLRTDGTTSSTLESAATFTVHEFIAANSVDVDKLWNNVRKIQQKHLSRVAKIEDPEHASEIKGAEKQVIKDGKGGKYEKDIYGVPSDVIDPATARAQGPGDKQQQQTQGAGRGAA